MSKPEQLSAVVEAHFQAAEKYRPNRIRLLLIAEAPPSANDRYFYFEQVREQDSLFRYVVRGALGIEPVREAKPQQLEALKQAGIFLIDSVPTPLRPKIKLKDQVDLGSLVARCRVLQPEAIVMIKATVYDVLFAPLRQANLPVIDERIPFPGSGQQQNFIAAFARALSKV